jgi:hypothetical protein
MLGAVWVIGILSFEWILMLSAFLVITFQGFLCEVDVSFRVIYCIKEIGMKIDLKLDSIQFKFSKVHRISLARYSNCPQSLGQFFMLNSDQNLRNLLAKWHNMWNSTYRRSPLALQCRRMRISQFLLFRKPIRLHSLARISVQMWFNLVCAVMYRGLLYHILVDSPRSLVPLENCV